MDRFRQFYIDNGDKLFGYLLRKSGSAHLAADLVQETFTRYLERYRNNEQSAALLFTMGRNLFYDQIRFNKRFVPYEENNQESVPGQEENYIAREGSDKILSAMARLSDDERDILALVVSSGLKYQEIADIRRCSVANIKVKVHRARQKLKDLLQENNHG
ncbi:MAG: RNA polymerase sigma factor [Proteobacteria bacterium]|nr:RNA polymerase sigma factor [Pseudomonadota bacterium]